MLGGQFLFLFRLYCDLEVREQMRGHPPKHRLDRELLRSLLKILPLL
jgi:hypothetical protein